MCYTCFYFYLWKMIFFLDETLDQTTTRNGFSGQNQIRRRYYIVWYLYFFLDSYFRSFDLDISTLKMKLNH